MNKIVKSSFKIFFVICFISIFNHAAQAEENTPPDSFNMSQKNAFKAAEEYLNTSSFSRKGLINQLSGADGFSKEDATAAVGVLNVDWKEQAVKSANSYLEQQGFSCRGLIDQLSSSAGDNYSVGEATYAAKKVGLCPSNK